jgi:hypothetical protein
MLNFGSGVQVSDLGSAETRPKNSNGNDNIRKANLVIFILYIAIFRVTFIFLLDQQFQNFVLDSASVLVSDIG